MVPRRIVVLNFTGTRDNWGCQATSQHLLDFLRNAFSALEEPQIDVVPYLSRHVLDLAIETWRGSAIESILSRAEPSEAELDLLERLVRRRFRHFAGLVEAADLVVFQGEGTMGRSEFLRGVRLFALPVIAKRRWRKPVIALNQSVYATGEKAKAIVRTILSSFDLVAVREPSSLSFCHDIGLAEAILCPDMAFLASSGGTLPSFLEGKGYFCVTGSAALRQYRLDRYLKLVALIADRHELKPVFLHCKPSDRRLAELAQSRWGRDRITVISPLTHPDYRDIMPLLKNARFVIGGRYHTHILASTVGTPAILLPANTHKQEGLALLLDQPGGVHPPVDGEAILAEVQDVVAHPDEHRRRIAAAVARIRANIAAFGQKLGTVADAGSPAGWRRAIAASASTPPADRAGQRAAPSGP